MSTPIATPQEAYIVNSTEVQQVVHNNVTKDGIWQPASIMPAYSQGSIVWYNGERYIKKNNAANNETEPASNTADWMTLSDYFLQVFNDNYPDGTPLLFSQLQALLAQILQQAAAQNEQQEQIDAIRLIKNKNFTNINWGNGLAMPTAATVYLGYLIIIGEDTAITGAKIRITRQNQTGYLEDISSPLIDGFNVRGIGVYKNRLFFYGGNGKLYKTYENGYNIEPISTTGQTEIIQNHFVIDDVLYLTVGGGSAGTGILKTTDLINFNLVKSGLIVYRYAVKKFNGYIYFGGSGTPLTRTNNNGNSFEDVPLLDTEVFAMEEFLGSLYLSCNKDGRNNGLYKMTNPSAQVFERLTFDANNDFTRFLIKFKNFLIVGSNQGRIYRSVDGSTFTPCVVDTVSTDSNVSITMGWVFDDCLYLYAFLFYSPVLFFSKDGINFSILQPEFSIRFAVEYYKNLYIGSSQTFNQTVGGTVGLIKKTLTL